MEQLISTIIRNTDPVYTSETRVISEISQATRVTQKCVSKRSSYPGVLPAMTQLGHSQDVISEYSEATQLDVYKTATHLGVLQLSW